MSKQFDEYFEDSNEFTFYTVTIESENGETAEFQGVRGVYAARVYDDLLEQSSESEP